MQKKRTIEKLEIPDYAIERLAKTMYPMMQAYFESAEGQKELQSWEEEQMQDTQAKCA